TGSAGRLSPAFGELQIALVQVGDRAIQRAFVAAVLDHVVGQGESFGATGLLADHAQGQYLVDAVAGDQAVTLHRFGRVDQQHAVDPAIMREVSGRQGNGKKEIGACSAATRSRSQARTRGWMIASSVPRAAGSANTRRRIAARSSWPLLSRASRPNAAATAASPSEPGATTSRAATSAS